MANPGEIVFVMLGHRDVFDRRYVDWFPIILWESEPLCAFDISTLKFQEKARYIANNIFGLIF